MLKRRSFLQATLRGFASLTFVGAMRTIDVEAAVAGTNALNGFPSPVPPREAQGGYLVPAKCAPQVYRALEDAKVIGATPESISFEVLPDYFQ